MKSETACSGLCRKLLSSFLGLKLKCGFKLFEVFAWRTGVQKEVTIESCAKGNNLKTLLSGEEKEASPKHTKSIYRTADDRISKRIACSGVMTILSHELFTMNGLSALLEVSLLLIIAGQFCGGMEILFLYFSLGSPTAWCCNVKRRTRSQKICMQN
jgi:hypothetical protein